MFIVGGIGCLWARGGQAVVHGFLTCLICHSYLVLYAMLALRLGTALWLAAIALAVAGKLITMRGTRDVFACVREQAGLSRALSMESCL
jgi:hypothetical protein